MAYWAHVLWQRHNLRPEEFDEMPRAKQLFYVASELEEMRKPVKYPITAWKGGGA